MRSLIVILVLCILFLGCQDNSTKPVAQDSPNAPEIDSVTVGNGELTIYWSSVPDAASYIVFRDTLAGVTDSSNTIPAATLTWQKQEGLQNDITYYFRVAAVGSDGQMSELSAELSATPVTDSLSAPQILTVASVDSTSLKITWNATAGATRYILYWAVDSGVSDTSAKIIDIAVLSYVHTGLSKDSTYYYRVSAQDNGTLTSPLSIEISGKPQAGKDTDGGKGDGEKGCSEGDEPIIYNGSTWECINGEWTCTSGDCSKGGEK